MRSLCTKVEGAAEDKLGMVQNGFERFSSVFNMDHKRGEWKGGLKIWCSSKTCKAWCASRSIMEVLYETRDHLWQQEIEFDEPRNPFCS